MCAMALVHQRVRRVVYALAKPEVGALGSTAKLHALKGLNHRYTAIKASIDDATLEQLLYTGR
eukprot:jgi/Mesen1/9164/ME000591S08483